MHVNRIDLTHPEGARDGHIITPGDDIEMIDIMFGTHPSQVR